MATTFEIRLFGATSVRTCDRVLALPDLPGGKPRQVLELIALGRGAVLSKEVLADRLWTGRPPQQAIATLETYIAVLRRALEPGAPGRATIIRTAPGGYLLDTTRAELDLDVFDRTVAEAAQAAPARAVALWERAVDLAARPVLEHEPHAEWAQTARHEYQCRGVRAAVQGALAALAVLDVDTAVPLAESAVARDPLAEDGWQVLIEAHGLAGRPTAAALAFRACRDVLLRELGLHPSPRTRRVLQVALARRTELRSVSMAHAR